MGLAGKRAFYDSPSDALLACVSAALLETLSGVKDEEEKTQRIGAALERADAELDAAEEMYASCAAWGAQVSYGKGMFYGVTVLMAAVAALVMIQRGKGYPELDRFLLGLGAGGVGAIVSVMQRISSGNLRLNLLAEHKSLQLVGSFRPLIGSLFGAAFVVLNKAGLLSIPAPQQNPPRTFYFLASLAFLAGFSERFAQVTLSGVSRNELRSTASETHRRAKSRVGCNSPAQS